MGQQAVRLGKAAKLRIPGEELVPSEAGKGHSDLLTRHLGDEKAVDAIDR